MNPKMLNLLFVLTSTVISASSCDSAGSEAKRESSDQELPGIEIVSGQLKVRFVDNATRHIHLNDSYQDGMNGIASLIHSSQGKNIFATSGMNLECTHTDPPAGALKELWNAPRVGAMKMEQVDPFTVKYSQNSAEVSGLNMEIVFRVGESHIDQTITTWPDQDIESSSSFWASYMNQVQYTSLFIRNPEETGKGKEWLEIASAGHSASDGVGIFARPYDPCGMTWENHLKDNPLLRQAIIESPESRQATLDAGFTTYPSKKMDHFYYGLVDNFVYLMIFREPDFIFWTSASGGAAVRSPAWDYEFISGPQMANERRSYHVRLVYKPFVSMEDILNEVESFLKGNQI
jgi:hypothetical protein